jgi:hypothetical protein
MTMRMKPHKTDQPGRNGDEKSFLCDPDPESLSAGTAVMRYLQGDPAEGDPSLIPLFRDPR